MKYAIFSDIDGTIYSHKQTFHPKTKEDIQAAKDKGIEFILCTGNPFFKQMRWIAKELDVDYFIGSNGATIRNARTGEIIFTNQIDKESAQKILDIGEEIGIGADWWDHDNMYASKYIAPEVVTILQNVNLKGDKLITSSKIENDIDKIEFYGDPKLVDVICERLKDSPFHLARMKPQHVEITKTGVSKGVALKFMSEKLGVAIENTMAIGDSANDWPMLEVAGFSYAMGNASDETKKHAKYHTSSVEQNGIGEAVEDFIYRNKI